MPCLFNLHRMLLSSVVITTNFTIKMGDDFSKVDDADRIVTSTVRMEVDKINTMIHTYLFFKCLNSLNIPFYDCKTKSVLNKIHCIHLFYILLKARIFSINTDLQSYLQF